MTKREKLFNTAISCIGTDQAPQEDEYGCMEALNQVFKKAFNEEIGGGLSTYRAYQILKVDTRFQKVLIPLKGDIILSPTGYGNGTFRNGHTGIVGENEKVMSNTSANGLWLENYTLTSWKKRYKDYGGFPMAYFRVVGVMPEINATASTSKELAEIQQKISWIQAIINSLKALRK